ncbi:MAG: response regulator transcription factor [Gaiella sp.]
MRTVLVVDDHPSFRASARAVLEEGGYLVSGEAWDGSTALERCTELAPDLVLLDVQLPDMTGFEVCDRLRATALRPAVILVSSREASDYGDLIADSGALGFISKADLSGPAVDALMP